MKKRVAFIESVFYYLSLFYTAIIIIYTLNVWRNQLKQNGFNLCKKKTQLNESQKSEPTSFHYRFFCHRF